MATSELAAKSFVARRPLLTFSILSYGLFWLLLVLSLLAILGLGLTPTSLPSWLSLLITIIGSWMPTVAAVFVTGILDGRDAIRKLFSGFVQFHFAAKWYIAALIPFGLAFVAAVIYRLGGGAASGGANLSLSFWVGLFVVNLVTGPTGEEAGWRGFALPRLLEKYDPLRAGLILGTLWDFWHLPLWIIGRSTFQYCLAFSVGIISLSVLMTWIFRKTLKSLVPMAIIHFAYNVGISLIGPQGIGLGPTFSLTAIMAALCLLTAIVVWITGGLRTGSTSLPSS